MEDGLIVDNQTGIQDFISGEGYEFLFTEIGPLNQDGNPEIIQGSFEGDLLFDISGFYIKGSYRLKPL